MASAISLLQKSQVCLEFISKINVASSAILFVQETSRCFTVICSLAIVRMCLRFIIEIFNEKLNVLESLISEFMLLIC